jgi:hypothetical protein
MRAAAHQGSIMEEFKNQTLPIEGRKRDLALFNLASTANCAAVMSVAFGWSTSLRADLLSTVRSCGRRRTGHPVRFEITEQTRQALDDFITAAGKQSGEILFTGRDGTDRCPTTRQYARLVSERVASTGLDPSLYRTHSLRRTKATSTSIPATCALFSYFSGTQSLRVPSGTSV